MSNKEAINLLKQVNHILVNDDDYWTENTHEPLNTAFSMAIKALEQKPSEDCISRKALLDKKWDVPYDGKYIQVVDVGDIEELPSVQLERPKGHWINIDKTHSKCDRCGSVFEIVSANYCPHCGCKME